MNKIYRVVFNVTKEEWQAVCELSRASRKGGVRGVNLILTLLCSIGLGVVSTQSNAANIRASDMSTDPSITIEGDTDLIADGNYTLKNLIQLNASDLTISGNMDLTLQGDISGTGGLVKNGAGDLRLEHSNSYTGGTRINAGNVIVNQNSALGIGLVRIGTGSALIINSDFNIDNIISLGGGAILNNSGTLSGQLNFNGSTRLLNEAGAKILSNNNMNNNVIMVGDGVGNIDLVNKGELDGNVKLDSSAENLVNLWMGSQITGHLEIGANSNSTLILNGTSPSGSELYSSTVSGTTNFSGKLNITGEGTWVIDKNLNVASTNIAADSILQLGNGDDHGEIGGGAIQNNGALVLHKNNIFELKNTITGVGRLVQLGGGSILIGANNYTGTTEIKSGTLQAGAVNTFSGFSTHYIFQNAIMDLAGYSQILSSVKNSGVLRLSSNDDNPNTTLKITGEYIGDNGELWISTVLGGDGSATDRLLLSGENAVAKGTTIIKINNANGLGAQTVGSGIQIIGTENGGRLEANSFVLADGHIDAGVYEYRLFQTESGAALKSMNNQLAYRSEAPLLSALPEQLRQADLAMLADKKKRLGDDYQLNGQSIDKEQLNQSYRIWSRTLRIDPKLREEGTVSPESEGSMSGFQLGLDLYANESLNAGLYVGQLAGDMNTTGFAGGVDGKYVGLNQLRSRYIGISGEWQDMSGLYANTVVQRADYRNSLKTANNLEGNMPLMNGLGWAASVEMGKSWALNNQWKIEPQIQVIYQDLDLDDTTLNRAKVENNTEANWTYRLGTDLIGGFMTDIGLLQLSARVSLYKAANTVDHTKFIFSDTATDIQAKSQYFSTETALGATLHLTKNTSLYGGLTKLWDNGGDSQLSSGLQGSFGVKGYW